ncbi:hypothetical protein ACFYZ2_15905 [Streptomyces sviceus]|uniref:hypothetical protein n=1 Tax=Streptomyces sviceus TaxID=285530 RepID=UPI0036C5CD61
MAQDAWTTVRERVPALFGRGAPDSMESVGAALDQRERLLVLLHQEPAPAEELRALVAHAADQPGSVHNVITGAKVRGLVVQAHSITMSCTPADRRNGPRGTRC